ncbi:MAG: ATP-binding protein [Planctomycetaceae bacterium]|jgi:hypothetical protein|nr:ATP-binding protein [Planctomycetaceae bacterium]
MSLLETIHSGKRQSPPRILVYGTEGIGKSTFASTSPNPIFIPTEDGLDNIDCAKFPLCKTFVEVMSYIDVLQNESHDYRTIIIDTVDWLERLIWDFTCQQYRVENIERVDGGYGKGYTIVLTHWRRFVESLRNLRDQKNMIVVLLAHAQVRTHSDPESTAFDTFLPKLHKNANAILCEWCDAILLATREFGAAKGETGGGQRILRCAPSPVGIAKNRFGLPEVLPMNWSNLMHEMYRS